MSSIPRAVPAAVLLPVLAACGGSRGETRDVYVPPTRLAAFQPLPASMSRQDGPATAEQVELGRRLFSETGLSAGNARSCNSCHPLERFGADRAPVSAVDPEQPAARNAPSVYNAAGHIAQFWDGRAADVEEQARVHLLDPQAMGMPDADSVVEALRGIAGYEDRFAGAFPGDGPALTFENVGRAIGAFERQLVTPGRWDAYLSGDGSALTAPEKIGFNTFVNVGCVTCHTGEYIGGSTFQKVGDKKPWPNQEDQGQARVSGNPSDAMMFKTPSLRNVAETAPYFHDGSVDDLAEAVRVMAEHQLAIDLDDGKVAEIVTWLESLTGEIPAVAGIR